MQTASNMKEVLNMIAEEIKVIEDFLNMLDEAKRKYDIAYEQVNIEDKRTNDLLHKIELDADYKERCKVATKLAESRKDRRYYKDIVEESEEVVNYIKSNQQFINKLKNILGDLRKIQKNHSRRTYHPRVEKF